MSNLCRHYTVMEVKKLMLGSEGKGPGVGGHAISEHGYDRTDVTDRNKPKDSAFERGWKVKTTTSFEDSLMKGVFDDYVPEEHVKQMVHSSDQFLAVCNALNSDKGQQKLKELDNRPDVGTHSVAFETAVRLGHLVPLVRSGSGHTASTKALNKMHLELFKITGKLHIHTAYAV